MQNLNTRPATRKVGQSTEIVKLLRIQASDTHVVEFDNVDSRAGEHPAGILCSARYQRYSGTYV
ncbi:hypothetical protein PWP92_20070 [Enterobacter hormaechei subsp. xiangfangensis]|uniref:hypothetical protein n=1 Tax=Enterobacter hormaechei TaxID=158836 RepID=UPI000D6F01B1|nr:hypothetical protein [Enterobacter hormaechei]MDE4076580.1 hypothetical protein [Enterobacter hormaechei subsp. xiangfangensis]